MTKVREFIDFWVENSVHPKEQFRDRGASQDVVELTGHLIEAAKGQGISEADLQAETGDIVSYIQDKLEAANKSEKDRRARDR